LPMQRQRTNARVLAVDLRASRFAYAIYDGPNRLLDWGGRACPLANGANLAGERVAELLKLFHPAVVVLKKDRRGGARNASVLRRTASEIRREAAMRSVPVFAFSPEEVKEAFGIFRVNTKDDVAAVLTGIFPELLWELPRKRKKWDNEHPRMAVFDAIAVGFAYFQRNGVRIPPSG
jgi:hypothetical protein